MIIPASPRDCTVIARNKNVFFISITNVIALLRIEDDDGVRKDWRKKTYSVGFECDAASTVYSDNASRLAKNT